MSLSQPAYYRGYGLIAGKPLKLEPMLAGTYGKLRDDQLDALYGRGWLLFHHLTFEPTRRGQLSAYLKSIGEGVDAGKAARTAFGDLRQLDRDLDRYLSKRLNYSTLSAGALAAPVVTTRRLTPAQSAMLPLRMRSKRGVDAREAARVVVAARKVAARHGDDGLVQVSLAEAEYDARVREGGGGRRCGAEARCQTRGSADLQGHGAHGPARQGRRRGREILERRAAVIRGGEQSRSGRR